MPEQYVKIDDGRLWTTCQGDGPPLILSSGGPGCGDYLGPVAGMVEDMVQVIRWEQRGCGRSSPTPPYDLKTCINDLETIRTHLGVESWLVGGHSWGANLSLAYALAHPKRIKGLVYIAGTGITEDWKGEYRQNRDSRGEKLPTFDYQSNLLVNEVGNASWKEYLLQPDLELRVSSLKIPAIIICAERDIRPRWPSKILLKLMPHARFNMILEAEHYIWLTHSAQLKDVLRDFIKQFR